MAHINQTDDYFINSTYYYKYYIGIHLHTIYGVEFKYRVY